MLHDASVLKYSVDLENECIYMVLDTGEDYTKLAFEGVMASWFGYIILGNAIYDLSIIGVETFININEDVLLLGKGDGWPIDYKSFDELKQKLERNDYKIYNFEGSYGIAGWIIAKEMKIIGLKDNK